VVFPSVVAVAEAEEEESGVGRALLHCSLFLHFNCYIFMYNIG
jgi:hypothetical protein